MNRIDRCQYPRCKTKAPSVLTYYNKNLCAKHWAHICSLSPKEARAILNIRESN